MGHGKGGEERKKGLEGSGRTKKRAGDLLVKREGSMEKTKNRKKRGLKRGKAVVSRLQRSSERQPSVEKRRWGNGCTNWGGGVITEIRTGEKDLKSGMKGRKQDVSHGTGTGTYGGGTKETYKNQR